MKLSKEQIVEEAISLLHEQGLKQVTLRNLADRLDMRAPSLFWYIKNKDELLALIDEAIFRECVNNVPVCDTWQEWMRQFGLSIWDAQSKAPDIPHLITRVNLSDETRTTLAQLIHDSLSGYGLDMTVAMKIQASVQALVTGWTVLTSAPHQNNTEIATGNKKDFSPDKQSISQALDVLISGWEAARVEGNPKIDMIA
jgi:TetR/AcrR family tetracycline transcriptional repressor